MSVLTSRSAAYWRSGGRPDLDRTVSRYFVYRLYDAAGQVVYIGRSCNVAKRIRAHVSDAKHYCEPARQSKAEWVHDIRDVSMRGPFTWDEAVREERAEIECFQPRGNRDLTARDRRPAIARRSASRAGAL